MNHPYPGSHRLAALFFTLALAAIGITPSAVSAQDVKRPVLGEHEFLPSPIFRGPFVQTTMQTRLGFGQALDIETRPPIQIDTFEFGGRRGNLNFALLSLGYTHQVTERFGLGAQYSFTGRLGDAANTILSEGATMDVSFDFAAKYRLYQGETSILTAGASLRRDDFTVIDIGPWVDSLFEDERIPLVTKRPSTRLGLDAIGAWAPVHWLGLQATAGFSRGKNLEVEQDTDWYSTLGLSADFDLLSVSSVPIGFVLGGRRDTFPRALNDLAKEAYGTLFRIAYTGRRDFIVALDFTSDRLPMKEGDTLEAGSFQLTTQYYF